MGSIGHAHDVATRQQQELGLQFTSSIHTDTYPAIDVERNAPSCAGKTVLITGGFTGMGRAIGIAFASAGASRIALVGICKNASVRTEASRAIRNAIRKPTQANVTSGEKIADEVEVLDFAVDICQQADVDDCAAQLMRRWGHVDILINNAGYLATFAPLGSPQDDPDEWWHTWEVNIRGVYLMLRAMLPLLLKGQDKTVVNLTSVGALGLTPGASAYQSSKFALMRLTEFLMIDYGNQLLLSYSVHPASVKTDLARRMPSEIVNCVCNDTPELAGHTIVYLTSQRREWLAGRYISCAWDMPEFMSKKEEIISNDLLRLSMRFEGSPPRTPSFGDSSYNVALDSPRGRVSRCSY